MTFSILKTQFELKAWRKKQESNVHFVPTMGGLHYGHGELIKFAKGQKVSAPSTVLVSIFVNPLQFNPTEDFKNYPRNLEEDCKLAKASGADAIWAPSFNDVFNGGIDSHFQLLAPAQLSKELCGASRPGHFDGVVTVILRLIHLVKPNCLFLGEKDWQQYLIIRQLIKDLQLPVELIGVPTIRDKDGLAYSSRNQYLNSAEKKKALELPKILEKAAFATSLGQGFDTASMKSELRKKGLIVEYLEVVDPFLLKPSRKKEKFTLLAAAILCGETRLIDHRFLMNRKPIVAIDGPAGSGKSTVTKKFAEKLGLLYLDTGAMYRAVTWLIQKNRIDIKDREALIKMLESIDLKLQQTPKGEQKVLINNEDVTSSIRSPKVTQQVSEVAALSDIRNTLTAQQRLIGKDGGIVAEGRDIGSSVFPNAELKVFLTASINERANRRAIDLKRQGFKVPDLSSLKRQIKERDDLDASREISPLVQAKDAEILMTDGMCIEEVVESISRMFRLKVPEELWPTP